MYSALKKHLKKYAFIVSTYRFLNEFLFYLKHKFKLVIHTVKDKLFSSDTEIIVPSAKLRYRVHGSLDRDSYISVGKHLSGNIISLCQLVDRDMQSFKSVLDFGCGPGRVLSNLLISYPSIQFYGTDIDETLIKWAKNNLINATWSVNPPNPPLSFPDSKFDLIYAISVFTHLDEQLQNLWLKELQRITNPDGILILTVHGDNVIKNTLPPLMQEEVYKSGLLYCVGPTGKLKTDELPDFYQTTFHAKDYIYKHWTDYFDIIDYVEKGIADYQDAVILKPKK